MPELTLNIRLVSFADRYASIAVPVGPRDADKDLGNHSCSFNTFGLLAWLGYGRPIRRWKGFLMGGVVAGLLLAHLLRGGASVA